MCLFFANEIPVTGGTTAFGLTTADLGPSPSLVVGNGAAITVLTPNASGMVVPTSTAAFSGHPGVMTSALVNGVEEVMAVHAGTNQVEVLKNNGTGGLTLVSGGITVGTSPSAITTATLNGETAMIVADAGSNQVSVITSNASGVFSTTAVNYAAGSKPSAVATGVLSAGAQPSIVVADAGSNTVSVLTNNGSGVFAAPVSYAVGANPQAVALADLNGDGKLDIIVANASSDSISVLMNNGNGTFAAAKTYFVGVDPTALAVADINGDGHLDIIVANTGSNSVTTLYNNGSGLFPTQSTVYAGRAPTALTVLDANGDIAVADKNGDTITVLVNATSNGTTITGASSVGISLPAVIGGSVATVAKGASLSVTGSGVNAINGPVGAVGTPGTVLNQGSISSGSGYGVHLAFGGSVVNDNGATLGPSISGYSGGVFLGVHGPGSIVNFGSITAGGTKGIAAEILGGGTVANGSFADSNAFISGYFDGVVLDDGGAVTNFGLIEGTGTSVVQSYTSTGVYLGEGGTITNGSPTNTLATIQAQTFPISIQHGAGTVDNYGTVRGTGVYGRGIVMEDGGAITNGAANDTTATIWARTRSAIYVGGAAGTVTNFGAIENFGTFTDISMKLGGTVVNGSDADTQALIASDRRGVYLGGFVPSVVRNFGTIASDDVNGVSAVNLYLGGTLSNGDAGDTTALITGHSGVYAGGVSTLTNFGTINGNANTGVTFQGGTLTNGSVVDVYAMIIGSTAVNSEVAPGTVVNFGTIGSPNFTGAGVFIQDGGSVSNGSTADLQAMIVGSQGINSTSPGGPVTVSNFGQILGINGAGITLGSGGSVSNGSAASPLAEVIGSFSGVVVSGTVGTVANFGTIVATQAYGTGVALNAGGTVTNGGTADSAAYIVGGVGVLIQGSSATVANFGDIIATSTFGPGVQLNTAGTVTNGGTAVGNTGAEIIGGSGITANGVSTVSNFGTILATAGGAVDLSVGGSVSNGASGSTVADIAGNGTGVYVGGFGTLTNFGTITGITGVQIGQLGTVVNSGTIASTSGVNGTAVNLPGSFSGPNLVVDNPGAVFIGKVSTSQGTLQLGSGASTGVISGVGGSAFIGFSTLNVVAGASWMVTGPDMMATVQNAGTLTLATSASLDISSSLSSAANGVFNLGSLSVLEVHSAIGSTATMSFLPSATLAVDLHSSFGSNVGSTAYTGPLLKNFGTTDTVDLKDLLASGLTTTGINPTTGLLQLMNGSTDVGTLKFDVATLASTTAHIGTDTTGHAVITV